MTPTPTPTPTSRSGRARPGRLDPDELAALEEQRDFLLRSLDDLDRERLAGDLDEADYTSLRDDYTARAAEVIRSIEAREEAFAAAKRPRSNARLAATLGIIVVLAVITAIVVTSALAPREAGDTASGGISVEKTPSQQAQLCIRTLDTDAAATVACYRKVLDKDPRNVVALTWLGWTLEIVSANLPADQAVEIRRSSRDLIERAIEVNPDYSYARAFRAVLAYRSGEFADAKQYLADFRAGNPSKDAEAVISQQDLETKIEAGLAASTATSTSTTSISTTSTSTP